jgi:signal transduction histidine kinase
LFRIAQEALANVRKHAGASHAWVTFIQSRPNTCEMVVDDDGRGFEPDASTRTTQHTFGLMTMRERAESLGGTFQITRRPGGGTRVVVSVPCGATTMEVVSDDDPSVAR